MVRNNYDSLTLKLHDSLDQYEKYAEKPQHANFFTNMVSGYWQLCLLALSLTLSVLENVFVWHLYHSLNELHYLLLSELLTIKHPYYSFN